MEDGKNGKWIVCKFCQSKVLRPSTASYEEREVCIYQHFYNDWTILVYSPVI